MSNFADQLLTWFDAQGRHDLPWQQNKHAYRVWVSEIMLQQTQVTTVIPYYQKFMARFPDVHTLAKAEQDEVMQYWAGLGYYSRARNLHRAAQCIMTEHNGIFPTTFDALITLSGIGRSTAGAILAISQQQHYAILDGNVKRVLTRLFAIPGWPGNKAVEKQLWELAESLLPKQRIDHYTQAIMDLGATLCIRSKPHCERCPVNTHCIAFQKGQPEIYPHKKPKQPKPVKSGFFVLLQYDEHWLLEKRPNKGIWGGLWGFPFFASKEDLNTWLAKHNLSETKWHSERKHIFTHFTLLFTPVLIQTNFHLLPSSEQHWHSLDKLSTLALPTALQRLLPLCRDASTAIS